MNGSFSPVFYLKISRGHIGRIHPGSIGGSGGQSQLVGPFRVAALKLPNALGAIGVQFLLRDSAILLLL